MESNIAFISDLKCLAFILNDGQRGYQSAATATRNYELKYVFQKYVAQRSLFERQLAVHLEDLASNAGDRHEELLRKVYGTSISINEAVISKSDSTLLWALTTAEQTALEKFDLVIQNHQFDQDHLNLLINQRDEIAATIKKMKFLQQKYED